MIAGISWQAPLWLVLLLPLPWLIAPLRQRLASLPATRLLRHPMLEHGLASPPPMRLFTGLARLIVLALGLLILAAAQPQRQGEFLHPPPPARSIILLVDASPSMEAQDFPVGNGQFISRIDAMKQGLLRFVAARPQDRFALIVVTSSAGTLVPMTADHAVLDSWIQQLRAGIHGSDTALGDGLALAIRQISTESHANAPAPLLVIWTDGFSTGGLMTPAEALSLARAQHIRLFTVNLAPVGSTPDDGQPSLAELAALSGGKPILAGDLQAMNQVTDAVQASDTPIQARPTERRQQPLARPLIAAALGLFLLAALLWLRGEGSV
ncbi:VWA domain-containing protein [Halothiobacillus sp. DCM-1]|uniref:VWA domain-containing protein n=1 Tax=Halothiobacillus sp. DCM-1 TaxID=3112558 RepID=UPI0032503C72